MKQTNNTFKFVCFRRKKLTAMPIDDVSTIMFFWLTSDFYFAKFYTSMQQNDGRKEDPRGNHRTLTGRRESVNGRNRRPLNRVKLHVHLILTVQILICKRLVS